MDVYRHNVSIGIVIGNEYEYQADRNEKWSEFLATDPEVPVSIPGATRFSAKSVWHRVHSAS
jgi:hypothetical protein